MAIRRRGTPWFTISKVVIDDYAPKIGVHGLAVYTCLVRACQDYENFQTKDVGPILGLEKSEVTHAIDSLLAVGILRCETRTNDDGTTTTMYCIVDIAGEYYGAPLEEPEVLPEPVMPRIPTKPSPPPRKGFVYIVEGEGYFKIGCTTNFVERIKALSVKAPFDMVVHLVIPSLDIYATEQELHRRFASKHRRGEWFNLDLKDIEDMRNDYQVLDPAFLSTE